MAKPPAGSAPPDPAPAAPEPRPAPLEPAPGGAPVSIAEKIRQRVGELSPSERRVARALLTGPPTIGLESSVRLARFAGVSGPTVSPFIAQLRVRSYAALPPALPQGVA